MGMDVIDRRILGVLQGDGKISLKELSALLKVTPSTISRHITGLEYDNIIAGYRASLNLEKLEGYHFMVEIIPDAGSAKGLEEFIAATPAFIQVFELYSTTRYILDCFWSDREERDMDLSHLSVFGEISSSLVKSVIKKEINL